MAAFSVSTGPTVQQDEGAPGEYAINNVALTVRAGKGSAFLIAACHVFPVTDQGLFTLKIKKNGLTIGSDYMFNVAGGGAFIQSIVAFAVDPAPALGDLYTLAILAEPANFYFAAGGSSLWFLASSAAVAVAPQASQ